MIERMIRAARLDISLYEEVEHDTNLTNEAMTVVIIVAILSGIGSFIGAMIGSAITGASTGGIVSAIIALVGGVIASVLGWAIWAFLTYFIGTRLFGGTATWGELLRTLGYAESPGVLLLFSFIPCLSIVPFIWTIVTGVVAVRQALDFDTGKAILTCVISIIPLLILYVIVFAIVGGLAAVGSSIG